MAPPEPELQHAALRLTPRGWETAPLLAPDGSGAIGVTLDLRTHEAEIDHSDGRSGRVALTPHRSVADVTRDVLSLVRGLAGDVEVNLIPQEVPWSMPLDEDREHARYDTDRVEEYFAAATQAAHVLAAFRAPYRGRSTPVNAWWGSFDLAANLFSGKTATPPSTDFIMRNSMDAQEVAVGWWPGDARYGRAAFYAYAHPAPEGFSSATIVSTPARWDPELGEYLLDWDDIRSSPDPRATALAFAHSVFRHACQICDWDEALAASARAVPPPVN
jgi:hypothetical protein